MRRPLTRCATVDPCETTIRPRSGSDVQTRSRYSQPIEPERVGIDDQGVQLHRDELVERNRAREQCGVPSQRPRAAWPGRGRSLSRCRSPQAGLCRAKESWRQGHSRWAKGGGREAFTAFSHAKPPVIGRDLAQLWRSGHLPAAFPGSLPASGRDSADGTLMAHESLGETARRSILRRTSARQSASSSRRFCASPRRFAPARAGSHNKRVRATAFASFAGISRRRRPRRDRLRRQSGSPELAASRADALERRATTGSGGRVQYRAALPSTRSKQSFWGSSRA